MKNIDWDFLKKDMTFIILNCLVNRNSDLIIKVFFIIENHTLYLYN